MADWPRKVVTMSEADDRGLRILEILEDREEVTVLDLVSVLGVSAVTVRKDVESLERRALAERTRGGVRSLRAGVEGAFGDRLAQGVRAKQGIAAAAAALVPDGAAIAVDASTTSYFFALELLARRELTVITNSLRIAGLLSAQSDAEIVLLGGAVRRASEATTGADPSALLGYGRIRTAFFGAAGLSIERGLLEASVAEAETKRAMAAIADQVVVLADARKFTGFGMHPVIAADRIGHIITDHAPPSLLEDWQRVGVRVEPISAAE